jgi:uncharacterized protein (TIGR03083 family)
VTTVLPDHETICAALRQESRRVAGLIRGCVRLDTPVPGLDWTTGQVAVHLSVIYRVFAATVRGEPFGAELDSAGGSLAEVVAKANALALEVFAPGQPAETAGELEAGAAELSAVVAACPDLRVACSAPWYGPEVTIAAGTLAALAVSETLVHGHDLARAVGGGWRLPARPATAVAPAVMSAMLPRMLDPARAGGFTGGFDVRVRGGQRFVLRVAGGTAWTEPAGSQRADCVVSMSGRAALLTGLGRQPLWRAVLTGGIVAFGRKPWLAPRLLTMFPPP